VLCALGWELASILLFSLFITLGLAIKVAKEPRRRHDDLDVPLWVNQENTSPTGRFAQ
jgi:hypothetical protein